MPNPQLEPRDILLFEEGWNDEDSLLLDIRIKRCVGMEDRSNYPGEVPKLIFNSIFTRAAVKTIPIGEVKEGNGLVMVGDLLITTRIELRGPQPKGDGVIPPNSKMDPTNVADHVFIDAPYQGEWFVAGIPQPLDMLGLTPNIWQVNIRRIKGGRNEHTYPEQGG